MFFEDADAAAGGRNSLADYLNGFRAALYVPIGQTLDDLTSWAGQRDDDGVVSEVTLGFSADSGSPLDRVWVATLLASRWNETLGASPTQESIKRFEADKNLLDFIGNHARETELRGPLAVAAVDEKISSTVSGNEALRIDGCAVDALTVSAFGYFAAAAHGGSDEFVTVTGPAAAVERILRDGLMAFDRDSA